MHHSGQVRLAILFLPWILTIYSLRSLSAHERTLFPFHQMTLSMVEKISAATLRVANMEASVRFYKDILGLEIIYGGEGSNFTSLRTKDGHTILSLEHGNAGTQSGRLIFHVSDVDRFWAYLKEKGFHPDSPKMPHGVNAIFLSAILMALSFHLLVRSSLKSHPHKIRRRLAFHERSAVANTDYH
jgi:catechol 2,3-dioxygenase-like lactoylglutathione lyase family enzyme